MINLQSNGPLGLGESPNPSNGNSILTLKNKVGENVDYPLWINDFSTDLNMEIDMSQLRSGYTYRPIRIQERTITFTTIWSLANRPKYEKLVEAIRNHWAYNLNELVPTPAYFTYFGANKTYAGFILNAQRSYAVPDTVLSYTFDMKLMNTKGMDNAATVSQYSYYVPHPSDIELTGIEGWYSQSELNLALPSEITQNITNEVTVQQREGGTYVSAPVHTTQVPYPIGHGATYTEIVAAWLTIQFQEGLDISDYIFYTSLREFKESLDKAISDYSKDQSINGNTFYIWIDRCKEMGLDYQLTINQYYYLF